MGDEQVNAIYIDNNNDGGKYHWKIVIMMLMVTKMTLKGDDDCDNDNTVTIGNMTLKSCMFLLVLMRGIFVIVMAKLVFQRKLTLQLFN